MRLGAAGGVGARHGRVRAAWARAPRGEADMERVESGVDSHPRHGHLLRHVVLHGHLYGDVSRTTVLAVRSERTGGQRLLAGSSVGTLTVVRRGARVFAHADMDRRVLQHVAGQDVAHAEVRGANGQVGVGVELREDGERGAVRRNDRAAKEVVVRQGEREGPLRTTGVGRRELRWAGGRAGGQRPARTFGAPMCVDVGVN